MHDKVLNEKRDISTVTEVEMDEMHHYFRKNLRDISPKLWIWKTIDHRSKKLIGWALERSDPQTLIKMYDSMGFDEFPHVYSEHYESYIEFLQQNNLT